MNKIYDKLLLAVALLLLAGGIFLYLQTSKAAPDPRTPVNVQTGDNPYQPVAVASSASTEASWPPAAGNPSRPDWIYDVFTPPKIYINADGQFTQEGWKPTPPPPPFGIYLAAIERKLYRIQLEGYIEEDRSDPSKTLLLLYDEEAQQQVRARPGAEKPAAQIKVLSVDIQRLRDPDNNIQVLAQATLLDQRTGERVTLKHGERKYASGVTVIIRSEQDPSYRKELSSAPTQFEGPIGNYTLQQINLEAATVTVEKQASTQSGSEPASELTSQPETRTLSVRTAASPAAPTQDTRTNTPTNTNNTSENVFDIFN